MSFENIDQHQILHGKARDRAPIIIGGGLAGLFCALKLAPMPCVVLSLRPLGEGSSSAWAQGGIAAAISHDDSIESHIHDTLNAGAGLCDSAQVATMAKEAAERIHDLLEFGVPFDRDLSGRLLASREAAHSKARVVRVKGDKAGAAIMQALITAVRKTPSIRVLEGVEAEELLVHRGKMAGVRIRDYRAGSITRSTLASRHVILATGGIGQLYAVTTNPAEARASGLAMAARAGARLKDCEFVQFHPTAIDIGIDPAPLATEALRGEGATLIGRDGTRFMQSIHPDAELSPRDIVARAVFEQHRNGKGAYLDCRTAIGEHMPERFPTVTAICRSAGIDPLSQPIPVISAEHYHMGGVECDTRGRSTIFGLYAAGEVACTGVHGANRLASNSLLEAVVFAARIAEDLRNNPEMTNLRLPKAKETAAVDENHPTEAVAHAVLRKLMHEKVGVIRNGEELKQAIADISNMRAIAKTQKLKDSSDAALIIAVAAHLRKESRGSHMRTDYPELTIWPERRGLSLKEVEAAALQIISGHEKQALYA